MRINKYYLLAILLFIAGFVVLGVGVAKGEGTVAIVLFIPVVSGSGILMFLGFICLGLGFLLFLFGFFERVSFDEDVYFDLPESKLMKKLERLGESGEGEKKEHRIRRKRMKTGGVLFIGPFPIIYGSDMTMGMVMALLTVVILLAAAVFLLMLLLR